ncbi:MAG: hypothetical protein ABWX69_05930 [Arthrobacter sp.]
MDDAAGIAGVHVRAWGESYAHLLPPQPSRGCSTARRRQGGASSSPKNPRAYASYRRNGFVPDGAISVRELLGTPVRILRMVR